MKIITPDAKDHRLPINDLLATTWNNMSSRIRDVHHDWDTSKIGIVDDTIVTFWGVFDIHIRIGSARIHTAGIDGVVTHPDYRKRGLMTQTAHAALEAMQKKGYVLSLLNGMDQFYDPFGYVNVWPQWYYKIRTDDLPEKRPAFALEEFVPDHHDALADIYNQENANLTGTAVRPTYMQAKWPGSYNGYLWKDVNGNPLGYVIGGYGPANEENKTFTCKDAAGDPEHILQLIGVLSRQWGYQDVEFERVHYHSRLAKRLRGMRCQVSGDFKASGDFMMAILNLPVLFEQLSDELTVRLQRSPFADWTGDLQIEVNEQSVLLTIKNGKVHVGSTGTTSHLIRGGSEFAQLVMGTEPARDVIERWKMEVTGDAISLAEVFFPAQFPQIASIDL